MNAASEHREVSDLRFSVFRFAGGEFFYAPQADITPEEQAELEPFLMLIRPAHDMTRGMKQLKPTTLRHFQFWKRPGFDYSTDPTPRRKT